VIGEVALILDEVSLDTWCFLEILSSPGNPRNNQLSVDRQQKQNIKHWQLHPTSCEVQWLVYLLKDFHINHSKPALLYTDNKPASEIASNLVHHERTKHIQLDCHLIREKLQDGLLTIIHIPSRFQLADALTKPLGCLTLHPILSKIGMVNIHSHLEGGYWNLQHSTSINKEPEESQQPADAAMITAG
jgi:hypothetical protein